MGSSSDWATMKETAKILDDFGLAYEKKVVSAHRTPALMAEFSSQAREAGYKVIIAGAGGAAHLPGMVSAQTLVPVIGVPIKSRALSGLDSLYSNCSNAGRGSCSDNGNWRGWSKKCCFICFATFGEYKREFIPKIVGLSGCCARNG